MKKDTLKKLGKRFNRPIINENTITIASLRGANRRSSQL